MHLIIFVVVSACFAGDIDLTIKSKLINYNYVGHGKLKPLKFGQVTSKISGQIVGRSVEIGEIIKKDQLLYELDPGTIPLEIIQVETEIDKQKLQLSHHKRRYDRRTKNPDAYTEEGLELEKLYIDKIKLEIAKLNTQKSMLQLQLSYKKIKAPFDGIITRLSKEVGDWVMLGSSTAEIQSINHWRLETEVPWDIYSQLNVGDSAFISKSTFVQEVELMAKIPVVNSKTNQFRLELSFRSRDWQPSQFEILPVTFSVKKSQLQIPLEYVKRELGTFQVKTKGKDGFRWLSVEGTLRDGFFYPHDLNLENHILKIIK